VKAEIGVGSLRIGQSGTDLDFDRGHFDFGSHDTDLGENSACEA
jgi:hypothetical protein